MGAARKKDTTSLNVTHRGRPATTPEQRENEIAAKAYDLAERQIEDGSAAAQVITHFLKAKSQRGKLEEDLIQMQIQLGDAKKEQIASAQRVEDLMNKALEAFRTYSPTQENVEDDG